MDHATHNKIVSLICSIANDCFRDVFVRAKYLDVILPMFVLRRTAVPPPRNQAKIAERLDEIDAQIDESKANISREIEKLNELRSTLVAHAVTGRIKVPYPES